MASGMATEGWQSSPATPIYKRPQPSSPFEARFLPPTNMYSGKRRGYNPNLPPCRCGFHFELGLHNSALVSNDYCPSFPKMDPYKVMFLSQRNIMSLQSALPRFAPVTNMYSPMRREYFPNLPCYRCGFHFELGLNDSATLLPNDFIRLSPSMYPYEANLFSKDLKRMKLNQGSSCTDTNYGACWRYELEQKKHQINSKVIDYSNPSVLVERLEELDAGRYGSATKDVDDITALRIQFVNYLHAEDPTLIYKNLDMENNPYKEASKGKQLATADLIDLEDDHAIGTIPYAQCNPSVGPLVIIDSDDEDLGNGRSCVPYQDVFLKKPAGNSPVEDFVGWESNQNENLKGDGNMAGGSGISKDKGIYVGEEDDMEMEDEDEQSDDGLGDIWNEMNVAIECAKDTEVDASFDEDETENGEDCDHSFILKDDIGYVCRICGIIQKAIESIIEYQFPKGTKNTQTYRYEGRTAKKMDADEIVFDGTKLGGHDFTVAEIAAHPRHWKQMKPHQVEGFKFLVSNLVADNPGGCIMAHAPGSGKTFMIISFLQSFMAKYPFARPLVVLPRGILATWKKEFERWQVEDLPLYDFYSVKADGRSQQLDVLKKWAEKRSILFLGYKQFSTIVCDNDTSKAASTCQEILLTCPSILILDEGHTPRNQDTDVLTSLEKVQTPRKVVLSGTLYQNHVKEVFNILNLVRPKFLRLETSKAIKRRILSRAHISSKRSLLKKSADNEFFELVEHTLLKDDNLKRKVTVIKDLREMTSKILHYYRGDFLDELPGLVDFTVLLKLSPSQTKEVSELRRLNRKFKISSEGSALYVHPHLKTLSKNSEVKDRVDEQKIDMILDKLEPREGVKAKFYLNLLHLCESSGEKLLVFSQYLLPLKFLERLTMKVKGYCVGREIFMITGDSDSDLRESSMERFNTSPDARVFFGSIKACGEGISLVGASRIIILDVHLNPSVTRQAIGRAFRPGQQHKVFTYRLVASDSPEEEDHATCFRKESIAKMWFEWNEYSGNQDFVMESVDVKNCGDMFLETPRLNEDVTAIYKR